MSTINKNILGKGHRGLWKFGENYLNKEVKE